MSLKFANRSSPPSVRLHIESLVLEGLPLNSSQSAQLQSALVAELSRLFTERGFPDVTGVNFSLISADPIHIKNEGKSTQVGGQIAQAIHGSLNSSSAAPRSSQPMGGISA